ncbi:uncharacterized protein MELLADRAFT_86531 [Melampsora larici-populina 98AG31]|uniref:LrgB-like protein n=1 Tax=Melampsora larici-populina (strain 98AG31 / pathotype 3-4-7) TaxID=747676 RepID=F4RM52_MELLP|nr:uncharacterized protein MELLADRAFT_86531 [Melampsora larici-populina 98AG31]EGG06365.1 hypothetical protein MELLADRAFT_86531 [Melampsora larici-populina 98AG31]
MKFISIPLTIFCRALLKFIREDGPALAITYITIICGVLFLLLFAFLIELCLEPLPIQFPATAIDRAFRFINASLRPAADWTIGNMGVFFTPSFILIPTRPAISAGEIGLLCAMFLPAFLITWIGTVLLCKLVTFLTKEDQNKNLVTTDVRESDAKKSSSGAADAVCINVMTLSQASDHEADRNVISSQAYTSQSHGSSGSTSSDHSNRGPNCFEPEKGDGDAGSAKSIKTTKNDPDFSSTEEEFTTKIKLWFNPLVYFCVFLVGLPLYFTPGGNPRSLPLFLSTLSLSWQFSRRVVPKLWQTALHPILVTSIITVLCIWGFGAMKGIGLVENLSHFTSGTTYLLILRHSRGVAIDAPGAGDVLKSILVAGIISLAFPLFKYRQGLYDNMFKIIFVTLPNCAVSLLLWPYMSHRMGIAPDRGVSFAGRFLSTPFGIQMLSAVRGDQSLVVVLICVTGILAVLTKDLLFALLRVRTKAGSDDSFTIGATLGVIGGAIGTATLMDNHPQAAAIATVTFVLYGVAMLSLVAIPQVANYVGFLAGLGL